jgi:hypothetical protein
MGGDLAVAPARAELGQVDRSELTFTLKDVDRAPKFGAKDILYGVPADRLDRLPLS